MRLRLHRPLHMTLAGGLAAALLGVPTGAGVAAYRSDMAAQGVLPAGSTVGGVDVSGLSRTDAIAAVEARFDAALNRTGTLRIGSTTFSVTPRDVGVRYDVAGAVERAFTVARRGNWLTRSWARLRDESLAPTVQVRASQPDRDLVTAFVDRVSRAVSAPARNAEVRLSGGFVRFLRAESGLRLDAKATRTAVLRAVRAGSAKVDLQSVPPTVPDSTFETVLLVRTGENQIYVYKHGKLDRVYGVATGAPRYPTPTGRFTVTLKRYRPTWVNPWSKWSMHEPAFIRPGPNNPLGTRAMNLSAPGIRIHGTPASRSIGYSVSHGCIRMRMPDVEALYDMVPTGTTVFIVNAGPPRFPGTAVPPPSPADAADGG